MQKSRGISKAEKIRLYFFFSSIVVVFGLLVSMPRVSIPLLLGYVVYLIVYPAVPTLEKIGVNRTGAIWLVFSSLIFFSTYPFVKVVPTISAEID